MVKTVVKQKAEITKKEVKNRVFSPPIAPDRFASPALSENINEDILAKIFNPSLGFDELNQQIKDEIRDDDVAGIAKVLAKDLDDRTLDDREYLGLVDAPELTLLVNAHDTTSAPTS
ncbi:hypothetical protein OAN13_04690 [Opitutales bacterium]|nr:hypothetical protein [Opitutales bacterium]